MSGQLKRVTISPERLREVLDYDPAGAKDPVVFMQQKGFLL